MANGMYIPKKCGVKFDPPAIVLSYEVKATGKLHRRTMPLRSFTKNSAVAKAVEDLRTCPRHKKYLDGVTAVQLERLVTIIKDKLNGMSLESSIAKNQQMDTINPEEDLNKVDEDTLRRKKAAMESTFEKNRKKPGDSDFQYDIEVEFDDGPLESCDWDSDGSDPIF
ncbi:centrosomal protein of 19 kDa-like [Liolophura sinensis]|uniref:centrosomal protein of 19 kDa-like n=1 Tax=Liolophura sinensis TaxID=3198878 RepID=UPI0031593159